MDVSEPTEADRKNADTLSEMLTAHLGEPCFPIIEGRRITTLVYPDRKSVIHCFTDELEVDDRGLIVPQKIRFLPPHTSMLFEITPENIDELDRLN